MPTEFKLPELGENVTTGDVLKVLVSAGDTIQVEQPVVELETDKATIEVPSSLAGTVKEIRVKAGDKVQVGQVILVVDDGAGASATSAPPPATGTAAATSASAEPEPVRSDPSARERGERERRDRLGETAEAAGKPRPGEPGPRGAVVDISRGARSVTDGAPRTEAAPAAPSVRRFARELGVDIDSVPGSGPAGRIAIDDVKAYARWIITSGGASRGGAPAASELPDFSKWGEIEAKPMSGVRRKTAEHLSRAWSLVPHVTQHDRADVTALDGLRKRYEQRVEAAGGKLTVTAIALKIVSAAIKLFPQFASSVDPVNEQIIYKRYCHIGVAVDTERGLLVPVIRDVDRKSITELSVELAQMAERARNRKLTLEEMEGGTFTITNLGGIGGSSFTPIVNFPEVAILGLSRATIEPVWMDGRFEPRLLLPLSLSYDHRAIDGADAIRFLRWVAEAFEQPFLLSLHG